MNSKVRKCLKVVFSRAVAAGVFGVSMVLAAFSGTALADTVMFNGMPVEYSGATTSWVGSELVLSFTTSGSLTLPREATADILVVGGGGSGVKSGSDKTYGSSGNGGQVVVQSNVTLAEGSYDMTVGLGGEGGGDTGKAGQASGISGTSYTAAGGAGAAKNSTGEPGTPIPGTSSDITGMTKTYGAGAAAASADGQGVSGAANTGNGGQGYSKNYKTDNGAGGSGIVVVRIKEMTKPSFVFQNQTVEYFGAEIVSQTDVGVLLKYALGEGSIDLPSFALVDYLVVGGGGSGGTTDGDAKFSTSGNGGQVKTDELVWLTNGKYSVKVGAGGVAQTTTKSAGNAGGTSSLVGDSFSVSAVGGAGGAAGTVSATTGAPGTPIPGFESSISGESAVYGTGGAAARKYKNDQNRDVTESGVSGAANTGDGGMAGGKVSGAGGSGVVYIYIHALKELVPCEDQTVVSGEALTIPADERWGTDWTVRSFDPAIATAEAAGSDVLVSGLELGVARVMVENETQVYQYNVTVTPFQKTENVLLSTLDGEKAILGSILGSVTNLVVGDESLVKAEVRNGKLYMTGLGKGRTTVKLETTCGTYTYNVRSEEVVVKEIELVKNATSGTSYSYRFESVQDIEGDGDGLVDVQLVDSTVTFTATGVGTADVLVFCDIGEGPGSIIDYRVTVKEFAGGIESFGDGYIVYSGASEVKHDGDDLILVYTDADATGSFMVPAPYTANIDILAIGGGGAGGSTTSIGQGGGGGGGGGFIFIEDKKFQAGNYYIGIGEGGKTSTDLLGIAVRGTSGGNSVITNAFGYAFAEAQGGGGGGAPANLTAANGLNGGCGGGAVWYAGEAGRAGSGSEGFRGGVPARDGQGGGGGGAGGQGGSDRTGGDGKECDITGETVTYAQGGMGGRDDTRIAATDATGIGNGGNGGNGGPGGAGADGAVIVRIKDMYRNIKVPVPTTNDLIRVRYVWEEGKTFKGLVYDEDTQFRSSTDAHLYNWSDAIASVTGYTSAECEYSEEYDSDGNRIKLGCGYYNFTIKLNDGYTWEDNGGQDTYGTSGTLSYRWSIVEDEGVVEAGIDINKSVTMTDATNATVTIKTFTSPESMNKRRDGVLMLGSLCYSHGFNSNIYDRALQAVSAVSDADYYWWFANPAPSDKNMYRGNTNENGTAIYGHLTKGEIYQYEWGTAGADHETGGQHGCLAYFYDMLYKVMEAEKNGGKKYGYIVFSFDGTALADTGYKTAQEALGYVVPHPHEREIVEWLAENFYKEGAVIWLDSETSLTGVQGTSSLSGILDPYSYLNGGTAHGENSGLPDQQYWTVVTTNNKGQVSTDYNLYQNQTYYGDADEVAKLLKSRIKIKPYNMELTDRIVSPDKGLNLKAVTLQACTNGVSGKASANEEDWVDLLVWDRETGTGAFPANADGETLGIPGASLTVDTATNEIRPVISNATFAVWTRLKIDVVDTGTFLTSEDATYNNSTGLWVKNPNDGAAHVEMSDDSGTAMHVEGEAETSVPWSYLAYPVTVTVKNGHGYIDGKDMQEKSYYEGLGSTVYYRGDGGYRLTKIIIDGTEEITGDDLLAFETSYSFDNIRKAHSVYVEYEPFFGTVTSAPVTNVYDGAVHLYDVTLEGWDESVPTEVRYARWEDRADTEKYYTAEEFIERYGSDTSLAWDPDELTDVADHEIAYRVFAYQLGYGQTFTDKGWTWVESERWETVDDACGSDHSVITPAPLVVRPEKSPTIGVKEPLPDIGIDIDGLIGAETLDHVIGESATNGWDVISTYRQGDPMGQYPTWVIDEDGNKLTEGDPELLDPTIEGDGNYGNYYILPAENFQAVVKVPIEIGGVPQGPGLDPELPYLDTGVDPVEKVYDGVYTGLVVEVTSTQFGSTEPLVEGVDYDIFWAIGDLENPATPPAGGIDGDYPSFVHAGTNVVWYYVKPIPGTDMDDKYFAASNYQYVVITPRPLVLESESQTWKYENGEEHTWNVITLNEGQLFGGDTLTTNTTATITNVGSKRNDFDYFIATGHPDEDHADGMGDYDVTIIYGTLKVTPGDVTVGEKTYEEGGTNPKYGDGSAKDVIKPYDGIGTNIVVDVKIPEEYTITYGTNAVDGTVIWLDEPPSFTDVCEEVAVWFAVEPAGEHPENYFAVTNFALVTILPAEVTVKAEDKYIAVGDPLPELTATVGDVMPGNVIVYDDPTCPTYAGVAGEYPITVTGEENQGNYIVHYEPGTLHVVDEAKVIIHYVDEDGAPVSEDFDFLARPGTLVDAADYLEHLENIHGYYLKEVPAPATVPGSGLELYVIYRTPDINIPPAVNDDPDKQPPPDYPGDINDPEDPWNPGTVIENDPERDISDPDYDPDEMPAPWEVVPDPFAEDDDPGTIPNDPDDPDDTVARTPDYLYWYEDARILIHTDGPGVLTWKDLLIDRSADQDAKIVVTIDGGDEILLHTGNMTAWDDQQIVFGGETNVEHVVEIRFWNSRLDGEGDLGAANAYVDNVLWTPYDIEIEHYLNDRESPVAYVVGNPGADPTAEIVGETFFNDEILNTTSDVDANNIQTNSLVGREIEVSDDTNGTQDHWYVMPDPRDPHENMIAETAPTLSPEEKTTFVVTADSNGTLTFDSQIVDPSGEATLTVTVTTTFPGTVLPPIENTYEFTAEDLAEWVDDIEIPLPGPAYASQTVEFTFTNNSDGTAIGRVDDIYITPYGDIFEAIDDEETLDEERYSNDPVWPWIPVTDPSDPDDSVAKTQPEMHPEETATVTVKVDGPGKLDLRTIIDDPTGSDDGETPSTVVVFVDGEPVKVYEGNGGDPGDPEDWIADSIAIDDPGEHTIEIVFTNDSDGDSVGYLDEVVFTPTYPLVIHYVDEDGTSVLPDYTGYFAEGEEYNIETPPLDEMVPNIEFVKGTMPDGGVEVTVVYSAAKPLIEVTKTSDIEEDEYAVFGQTITYTVAVTNAGNVTVTDIEVTDCCLDGLKLADGESEFIGTLAPGEGTEIHYTYVVTAKDIANGSVYNEATAAGESPSGEKVEGSGYRKDPTVEFEAALGVIKTSDYADDEKALLGDVITYTVTVINKGTVPVYNIKVWDELYGVTLVTGESDVIDTLLPGETATVHYTYFVTGTNIKDGYVYNVATAAGEDPFGDPTKEAYDDCEVKTEDPIPEITVTKTSDLAAGETAKLGQTIVYTVTVKNTGLVPVSDIRVVDSLPSARLMDGESDMIASLGIGESAEVHYTYMVTEADILAGSVVNAATAAGEDPSGNPVEDDGDTTDPTEDPKAELEVTKKSDLADGETASLGQTLTYTVTVKNVGNVTVGSIEVSDKLEGAVLAAGETGRIASLAPGASAEVHYTYVVTEADILAGSVVNAATAAGEDPSGNPVEDDGDTTDPTEDPKGELEVTKTSDLVDGETASLGQTLTYTVTVKNVGNVYVSNIKVSDELPGAVLAAGETDEIASLAPGKSAEVRYTYVVTEADILAGSIVNTATATGEDPNGNPVNDDGDTEDPTEDPKGELEVTKTSDLAAGETASLGQTLTYTVTVKNVGNVTVSNIKVSDELPGAVLAAGEMDEITTLAPGASAEVHYTYVVTEPDIIVGSVVNTATAAGEDPSGNPVEDDGDTEDKTDDLTGELEVTKTSDLAAGQSAHLGDVIIYTVSVANTGNVTVYNIRVSDSLEGARIFGDESDEIFWLAPGENAYIHYTYTVTDADIQNGKVRNVASACGSDPNGDPVEDDGETEDPTEPLYTVIVHYVYADGTQAMEDAVVAKLVTGDDYSVESPSIDGYTADVEVVSGTIGDKDVEVTVTYTPDECPVVIHYVDEDGAKLLDDVTFNGEVGKTVDAADYVEDIRYYYVKTVPAPAEVGLSGLELTIVYYPPNTNIPPEVNDNPPEGKEPPPGYGKGDDYPEHDINDPEDPYNPGTVIGNDPEKDPSDPAYDPDEPPAPWEVVPDPFAEDDDPTTIPDNPDDPDNTVARTPGYLEPGEDTRVVIEVTGPGVLTWDDLIVDPSEAGDATLTIVIDGGDPVTFDPDDRDAWTNEEIVFGGETDIVHVVEIAFTNSSDGGANAYVDNVKWDPYSIDIPEPVTDPVAGTDPEYPAFIITNVGADPSLETSGDTIYNGDDLVTVGLLDEDGVQTNDVVRTTASDDTNGTQDYWYVAKDPESTDHSSYAETAPTLSPNESTSFILTDVTGPVELTFDAAIDDGDGTGDDDYIPSELVVTIITVDTVTEGPVTNQVVFTSDDLDEGWNDGITLPVPNTADGDVTVIFTFTNNSDGDGTGRIDNISVKKTWVPEPLIAEFSLAADNGSLQTMRIWTTSDVQDDDIVYICGAKSYADAKAGNWFPLKNSECLVRDLVFDEEHIAPYKDIVFTAEEAAANYRFFRPYILATTGVICPGCKYVGIVDVEMDPYGETAAGVPFARCLSTTLFKELEKYYEPDIPVTELVQTNTLHGYDWRQEYMADQLFMLTETGTFNWYTLTDKGIWNPVDAPAAETVLLPRGSAFNIKRKGDHITGVIRLHGQVDETQTSWEIVEKGITQMSSGLPGYLDLNHPEDGVKYTGPASITYMDAGDYTYVISYGNPDAAKSGERWYRTQTKISKGKRTTVYNDPPLIPPGRVFWFTDGTTDNPATPVTK